MTTADTDTSQETRRQAYLAAMGVTTYFPRFVLPGAPAPRVQVQAADPQETEPQAPVLNMPKTALEQLLEKAEAEERDWREPWPQQLTQEQEESAETSLISDLSPAADSAQESLAEPQPEAPLAQAVANMQDSAREPDLRFRLALIPVSPTLSVIEQLPWLGNGQLPAAHLRLLWHILQSLGLSVTPEHLSALPFQWPILSAAGFDKGAGAARAALRAFVEQHIPAEGSGTGHPAQGHCLLMLGEGLAQALFAENQESSLASGVLLPLPEHWQLLTTLSLDQVLRLPTLKSTLWRDLRPLR